jgi:hypothetical protein
MWGRKKIPWCQIWWIWRTWQNGDFLFLQLLTDKQRGKFRGVVMYPSSRLPSPKLRTLIDELNYLGRGGWPCGVASFPRSFPEVFQKNNSSWVQKQVNNFLISAVAGSFLMAMVAISRWPILASVGDRTGNTRFRRLLSSRCRTSHLCFTFDEGTVNARAIVTLLSASGRVKHSAVQYEACSSGQTEFFGKYTAETPSFVLVPIDMHHCCIFLDL